MAKSCPHTTWPHRIGPAYYCNQHKVIICCVCSRLNWPKEGKSHTLCHKYLKEA